MTPIASRLLPHELPGFHRHHGIQVRHYDDDGYISAMVAYGHHERRYVVAAFNAYARERLGWRGSGSRLSDQLAGEGHQFDLHEVWAVPTAGGLDWPANTTDAGAIPVTVLDPSYLPPTPEEER